MIGSISQTRYIMDKYGISAKKKFGQNFLVEPTIINKVMDKINPDETIVEIGAGLGALTEGLAIKGKKVIAFEIDNQLPEILRENLKEYDNVEIINQDFLTVDMNELFEKYGDKLTFVSNLPYYITSELLAKIFTYSNHINKAIMMMQKEVADRFTKKEKGKDYNAVQLMAEHYCTTSLLTKVNRHNYLPAPNVDSAILLFEMKETKYTSKENEEFFKLVDAAFSQRRKMVVSNLKNCGYEVNSELFESLGILPTSRIEQLQLEDFYKIYEAIR